LREVRDCCLCVVNAILFSCVSLQRQIDDFLFLLFFIWWFRGGFPWFVFPLLGWGVGLLAHYLQAFAQISVTDRMAEKEYRRLKEGQQ
jgi:hypothetical protein